MPSYATLLYAVPLAFAAAGWVWFILVFTFRRRPEGGPERRQDPRAKVGIVLVMIGMAVVWSVGRRPFTPIVPGMGVVAETVVAAAVVVLVPASLWLMLSAIRTLGKQWSVRARVLEDHALVTAGPYGIVRHPIYTGMLALTLAVGVAYSHWVGLVVGLALLAVGTAVRVGSEERLLRREFGEVYDEYARRVPAIVPRSLGRRTGAAAVASPAASGES
jgi:protein-S-isoprenylcysteine O-methyltransferase Ste14